MRISPASMMIGLATTWLVVAFVIQPFRKKRTVSDRVIEAWVTDIRGDLTGSANVETAGSDEPLRYCSQCGRRIEADHRFCPGCGVRLKVEASE